GHRTVPGEGTRATRRGHLATPRGHLARARGHLARDRRPRRPPGCPRPEHRPSVRGSGIVVTRRVLVLAAAGLCAAACTTSSSSSNAPAPQPTSAASSSVAPAETESPPPGDIPDTTVYVAYRPPSGQYEVKVPEGWARTVSPAAVSFTDKLNTITIQAVRAAAPTVASARAAELPQIQGSVHAFSLAGI